MKKAADWCRLGQGQNDIKGRFSLHCSFVNVDDGDRLPVRVVGKQIAIVTG